MRTSNPTLFIRIYVVAICAVLFSVSESFSQESDDEPAATQPDETVEEILPTAEEVLAKSLDAMGGTEKLNSIQSTAIDGTISASHGTIQLQIRSASGGRLHITQHMSDGTTYITGCDGSAAWMNSSADDTPKDMARNDFEQVRIMLNLPNEVRHFDTDYAQKAVTGKISFAGSECIAVRFSERVSTGGSLTAYYDIETGLFAGQEIISRSPDGPVKLAFEVTEWKAIDDVKVFTRVRMLQDEKEVATVHYESIQFNDVDVSLFVNPVTAVDDTIDNEDADNEDAEDNVEDSDPNNEEEPEK